jgi:hypothetical protein
MDVNKCRLCDKSFRRAQDLKCHMTITHTIRLFKHCDKCNRKFRNKSSLAAHYKFCKGNSMINAPSPSTTTRTARAGSVRNAMTMQNENLNDTREWSRRNGIPNNCFNCFNCDRAFDNLRRVNAHIRSVHGKKALRCPKCYRRFTRQHNFFSHMAFCSVRNGFKRSIFKPKFNSRRGGSGDSAKHSEDCNPKNHSGGDFAWITESSESNPAVIPTSSTASAVAVAAVAVASPATAAALAGSIPMDAEATPSTNNYDNDYSGRTVSFIPSTPVELLDFIWTDNYEQIKREIGIELDCCPGKRCTWYFCSDVRRVPYSDSDSDSKGLEENGVRSIKTSAFTSDQSSDIKYQLGSAYQQLYSQYCGITFQCKGLFENLSLRLDWKTDAKVARKYRCVGGSIPEFDCDKKAPTLLDVLAECKPEILLLMCVEVEKNPFQWCVFAEMEYEPRAVNPQIRSDVRKNLKIEQSDISVSSKSSNIADQLDRAFSDLVAQFEKRRGKGVDWIVHAVSMEMTSKIHPHVQTIRFFNSASPTPTATEATHENAPE